MKRDIVFSSAVNILLHNAAADGDVRQIKKIISSFVHKKERKQHSWPGEQKDASTAASGGAQPNAADATGSFSSIEEALSLPDFLNALDVNGRTPLYCACAHGNLDVVELLLRKGASPNVVPLSPSSCPPLIEAVREGHDEIVETLLAYGANPDVADTNNKTALMYAVQQRRSKIIELLLERGACVANIDSTHHQTSLLLQNARSKCPINTISIKNE